MFKVVYDWAKNNYHIDAEGNKNIHGDLVGEFISANGGSWEIAEGIKYFLLN